MNARVIDMLARQHGMQFACGCVALLVCVSLCSCMSVKYDMRKIEQPVTMNANPFACDRATRPSMKPVDTFRATVSSLIGAGGGTAVNDAQSAAFEKIGGDPSLMITDVRLDTHSMGVYMVVLILSGVDISAQGTVQKMDLAKPVNKENAR